MPEPLEQTIQKCSKQLEGLFIYLGSMVCDKAAKGEIRIQFDPEHQGFCNELEEIFGRIQDLSVQPQEAPASRSSNLRGSLSPYVDLNVKLHETKKKFIAMREDVDSCLSLASFHLGNENRAKADQFVERLAKTENTINAIFEKISGSIRQIMDVKNKAMQRPGEDAGPVISSDEKKFLHQAEGEIHDMTRGVETLFAEAVGLFESIKFFYDKDAENRSEPKAEAPSQREEVPAREEAEPEVEAAAPEAGEEDGQADEEAEEEEQEPVPAKEEPAEEEASAEEEAAPGEESSGEVSAPAPAAEEGVHEYPVFDAALMESAERKLLSKGSDKKERFHILMTLFRSVESQAMVDFLIDFLERAPVIAKIDILDLVTEVEHPGLAKVYERFLSSQESLLRFKGFTGYSKLHPETMNSLMMRAAGDPEPSIRRLAANCIRPEDGNIEFATIVRLAGDPDDHVARIAIRKLASSRGSFVVSTLVSKLGHANPKIRKEAIDILKDMTGKVFGYRSNAPEKERAKAVKQWENFLKKNHSKSYSDMEETRETRKRK